MDVDPQRLQVMDRLARRLIEHEGAELTIRGTTDQRASLVDADFVIVAISVGGMDAWSRISRFPPVTASACIVAGLYCPAHDACLPARTGARRHLSRPGRRCAKGHRTQLQQPRHRQCPGDAHRPSYPLALAMLLFVTPSHAEFLAAWIGVAPDELATPALVAGLNHCAPWSSCA